MTTACWRCRTRPAGNDYAGPNSAYCDACQPRDTRLRPRGSQCGCAACGRIFATLTGFDRHQERWPRGHDLEGVFTGRCFDPVALGLELAGGVWGTPEGNRRREADSAKMTARQRLRQAQTGEQAPAHIPGTLRLPRAPEHARAVSAP